MPARPRPAAARPAPFVLLSLCTALAAIAPAWVAGRAQAVPPNDDCSAAAIVFLNSPVSGSNIGATTEPGSGAQCANSSLDVYYRFFAPASSLYSISLCTSPSNWDTVISVHAACPASPLTQIPDACNDDGCFSSIGLSVLPAVAMTAGTDYIIRVAGFGTANANSSDFTLVVTDAAIDPLGACCLPGSTVCIVGPQNACPQPGGRWLAGAVCNPNPCTQSIGACCNPATNACTLSTQTSCALPRVYLGTGTTCPAGPCNSLGACCTLFQTCQISTASQCAVSGGIYLGPGTSCLSCPPAGGCCCGTMCSISLASDCTDPNEFYLGDGAACTPASCPVFPPANGPCSRAAELLPDGLVNGTNVNAPASGPTTCAGGGDTRGVWYRLNVVIPGTYRLRTLTGGTLADTTVAVFSSCGGTQLGCNDDQPGGGTTLSRLDIALHPGTTYLVRVAGYNGAAGSFSLECTLLTPTPAPGNDACIDAMLVTEGTIPFTVAGATPDVISGCPTPLRDIWLRYVPTQSGVVTVSNCVLDDAITILSVQAGCSGAMMGCSQQNCGNQAQVSFTATAGTAYVIRVGEAPAGGTPEGVLTISCPQCVSTSAPDNCIECPDCASQEPEPCGANTNGGCAGSSDCPVSAIALGQFVCGTAWADNGQRDTDVFEFIVPAACDVSLCGSAQFPIRLSIITAACPATVLNTVDGPACEDTCVSSYLTPGTYRIVVSPSVSSGHPCGGANAYMISLQCGCDDEQAMYDTMGNLILPADIELPQAIPPDEYVNMDMGEVGSLYPGFPTDADDWYDCYPCDESIGGELPPEADQSTINTLVSTDGIDTGGLTLDQIAEEILNFEAQIAGADSAPNKLVLSPAPVGNYQPPATPRQLNPESCEPFQGRDIVFIHGFYSDPIEQKALTTSPPPEWPAVLTPAGIAPFYSGSYHADARAYWNAHILHFLRNRGYHNRVLIVSYPMTQRLDVAAECVLHQIADAMSNRNGVIVYDVDTMTPVSVTDFGTPSFVCISHSLGALVTDVALSAAAHLPGLNAGFVADHCKAHIALHGAFCGVQYTTPIVAASFLAPFPTWACNLAAKVFSKIAGTTYTCSDINNLAAAVRGSIMVDLVPAVSQLRWGWYCNFTPIRTLMIAGGHPSEIKPLKWLIAKGYDDGTTTLNTQTALFTPFFLWPSGYVPKPPPPDQYKAWLKVFDMGVFFPGTTSFPGLDAKWRAVGLFLDQVIDPLIKLFRFPGLVAAAGNPWLSPTGMLQPKKVPMPFPANILRSPRLRYHNHFTYLLSTTDHLGGAGFGYDGRDPNPTGNLFDDSSPKPNNEEVRLLTNRRVFRSYDIGAGGDNSPLINPACKPAVREVVRGRGIKLFRIGHRQRYLWIWKRRYHLMEGWQTRTESDYLYSNVLCNTQSACVGACCCGATCFTTTINNCAGPRRIFAGPNVPCNAPGNFTTPCCFADVNKDGNVTVQDIFDFLELYFRGDICADASRSGNLSVQDIFDFLGAFFAGC